MNPRYCERCRTPLIMHDQTIAGAACELRTEAREFVVLLFEHATANFWGLACVALTFGGIAFALGRLGMEQGTWR